MFFNVIVIFVLLHFFNIKQIYTDKYIEHKSEQLNK